MGNKPTTSNASAPAKKVANSLVTLSSAAVLVIYAAGYQRTRSAAEQFDAAAAQRRPVVPAPAPGVRSGETASSVVATMLSTDAVASVAMPNRPAKVPIAPVVPSQPVSEPTPTVAGPTSVVASEPTASASNAAKPEIPAEQPNALAGSATTEGTATPASDTAIAPATTPTQYKDGTYHAWGRSRHGDVYTFVVIEKGRIVHSGYDKCQTRWSCTLIDHLGPQVVRRQSAEVDYVSGATESGNAFYWGIVEALSNAKVGAVPETNVVPSEAK